MNNRISRLVTNSMLAALCAVLGYVSIDLGNMMLTLESFPITLGALLFGPVDGAAIALVGNLVYQILRYGISATTVLWILPYIVMALAVGFYAKSKDLKLTRLQMIIIAPLGELIIFLLNTGVIYIDSKIYGYYSAAYVFGTMPLRMLLGVGKGIVYGAVLHPLVTALQKFLKRR